MGLKIAGAAVLAAALAAAAAPARAQGGMDPCTGKVMAECRSAGGDLGACMRAHVPEIMACKNGGAASPAEAEHRGVSRVRELCGREIARYCKGAGSDAAVASCLKKHSAKLGPSCRESGVAAAHRAEKRLHGSLASAEKACRKDGERLCPGKTFRTGLGPCLKAHREKVSRGCRDAIMGARAMGEGYSRRGAR
ncbi:MAG: hypothetical protein KGM24_12780 [Elusimicrobia bacterium]|nr:hypothetical protein [Elusimicrobiota bacterium]